MRRILLGVLILLFSFGSFINVFAEYSIESGNIVIKELIDELKGTNYTFERGLYLEKEEYIDTFYYIYYNGEKHGEIYLNDNGISLSINSKKYESSELGGSYNQGFYERDFPVGHILYYFDEYKDKSKIINGVIRSIELNNDSNTISFFPGKEKKYYLNIRYVGDDSQSFLQNDHLVTKYILKNDCFSKSGENINGEASEQSKCMNESIKEQYLDSNITIKVINAPNFVILKKDDDGIDYFEIDSKYSKYSNIGSFPFEFDVFLNGQKEGFSKKMGIEILKPIILAVGELGPEGGIIFNNWKDISISAKKGVLDKKYKIAYIASENGTQFSFITNPEEMDPRGRMGLDIITPSDGILRYNYLQLINGKSYWTTIDTETLSYKKILNDEITIYNECIRDKNIEEIQKYECYKKYMGFSVNDEEIVITKIEETKNQLIKQLILSKHNIEKLRNGKNYISQFDLFIDKLSDEKLEILTRNLGRLSEEVRNNKTYKYIFDYLEAKALLKLNY